MGLPRLEKCCCFFDLKTGNIILGALNAFLSFCLFVVMIVAAVGFGALEQETAKEMEMFHGLEEEEINATMTGIYALSIILVFMFLAKFLFDLLFIYGVVMERAGIIKAYFIMWVVFTLLSMFTFFIHVEAYGFKTIVSELLYIGLNVYVVLVSHSFYLQLNMREEV